MNSAQEMELPCCSILLQCTVFKKKSTEEFSCFPYVMTLLNCLIYTWYGLPIVSHLWENLPLVTINGVGILLESLFIFIYFCYSSPKEKVKVGVIFVPVVVILFGLAVISAVVFDEHRHRKSFVGSFGLVASISMYGSPLVVMYKNKETPITTTVMSKWDDEKNKRTLELVVDVDHDGDANEKKFNNAC
ncbi:hypothetical protein Bca101_048362 [Brassica carinata]